MGCDRRQKWCSFLQQHSVSTLISIRFWLNEALFVPLSFTQLHIKPGLSYRNRCPAHRLAYGQFAP